MRKIFDTIDDAFFAIGLVIVGRERSPQRRAILRILDGLWFGFVLGGAVMVPLVTSGRVWWVLFVGLALMLARAWLTPDTWENDGGMK